MFLQKLHTEAEKAYNEEKWSDVEHFTEKALAEYFIEHQRCMVGCEDDWHVNSHGNFVNIVAGL